MQYCNDCFNKMDDDALHCSNCQSRDIRPFEIDTSSLPELESLAEGRQVDAEAPPKIDRLYLVEPKEKTQPGTPAPLYFHPGANHRKAKEKRRVENAIERNRRAAYKKPVPKKPVKFGAYLALYAPILVAVGLVGFFLFNSLPASVKNGDLSWTVLEPSRVLPPVKATTAGDYVWLEKENGKPVRWDPCRTIYWVENSENAPAGSHELLVKAFREIEIRTGLNFSYWGNTNEQYGPDRLPLNRLYRSLDSEWNPVLVTYLDGPDFKRALAASGNRKDERTAAFAGPVSAWSGNQNSVYVSGSVTVSVPSYKESLGYWGKNMVYSIFLHELGHLIGLNHVESRKELMYPISDGKAKFGPGDLKGLALAGQAKCLNTFDYPTESDTDWTK